jgi:Transglutaminase-like superfamily
VSPVLARLRSAYRRVRLLGWRDWWETLVALGLAAAVELGLRTVRLERLATAFGVPVTWDDTPDPSTSDPALPAWAARRQAAVERVMDRWPGGGTCLRRSLISGQRLRALGPSLRIGVARDAGELRAHAWIEIDGASLDSDVARFEPLVRSGR